MPHDVFTSLQLSTDCEHVETHLENVCVLSEVCVCVCMCVCVDISFTSASVLFLFCFCQFSVDPALEGDSHNSTTQWYSNWPKDSSIMQSSSVKGHQNGDSSKISLYVYLILFLLRFLKKLGSNRIVHGWLKQNP